VCYSVYKLCFAEDLQIIQTIESQDPTFAKLPKAQQALVWNISTSIISLVSSLSEAQDEIVEAISKRSTIINFLFGLLTYDLTPAETINEILSCLTALTEDNKPLVEEISKNGDWLKTLGQIKDSGDLKSVAACGVLHNVFVSMQWFDHNTPIEGASDAALLPILIQAMDVPKSNGTNGHASPSSPDEILRLALEITASIATSLQEALEHGSKNEKEFQGFDEAVEDLDDEDVKMDEDIDLGGGEGSNGDDDADEMTQEEIEADMALVLGDEPEDENKGIEEVTLDRLVRIAAPKLLHLSSPGVLEPQAQSYALSALNNIAWTVGSIDFTSSHLKSLQNLWSSLSQQIWREIISPVLASNTADIELASAITSLAWAIARSVKGAVPLQPEEHRKFMALYHASKGLETPNEKEGNKSNEEEPDAFQSLSVKSIGVLGCLAMDPAPIELNRDIGVFLITLLASLPDSSPADAVEALNQLFDIYADKSYSYDEAVFWGDNMYKHLEEIQPKAKKMTKAIDKRKFGELRERSDEAILNLGRFLVYKRKERTGKGK
jgi:hypothetical protein